MTDPEVPAAATPRILVIKLSALGDFVQASGAMEAIAKTHWDADLTLLTTPPFEGMGRAMGFFREIWTDGRPAWSDLAGVLRLTRRIDRARFERVYDLQSNPRTNRYFQLLRPHPPQWCGAAWGAALRHPQAARQHRHIQEVLAEQLALAGITDLPAPGLSWLHGDVEPFALTAPYALLAPGGAAHRPGKRWPAAAFGALARALAAQGATPVVLGHGGEESAIAGLIRLVEPRTVSLVGRTSFADIASRARGARLAIGNDTGPMQVAAAAGAPALVLFSAESDPALSAPRASRPGQVVETLRVDDLQTLEIDTVLERLRGLGLGP